MTQNMLSSSLGIVDSERLYDALQKARRGEEGPYRHRLNRTHLARRLAQGLRALG